MGKIRKVVSDVGKGNVKAVSIHEWVLSPKEIEVLRRAGWIRRRMQIMKAKPTKKKMTIFGYVWFSPYHKTKS